MMKELLSLGRSERNVYLSYALRQVRNQVARVRVARTVQRRGELPGGTFEVAVHFSNDEVVDVYQIRQWYEPLRQLAEIHPVVVISRIPDVTEILLRECPLPVHYARTAGEIEAFVGRQKLKLVLYVNHNRNNFQMLRYAQMFHVHISHGESEKSCMASNQAKAYDYSFVAGDAAVRRVKDHLLDFDADRRLLRIGRPQVDVAWPGPELPDDDRTVVLYAPTWEGDRPSMSYSSVRSHGPQLVRALVATGRHRVVFRPHPRTGVTSQDVARAVREIASVLEEANASDPGAGHLVDLDSTFGWHLRAADACVCDVSAVMFDWLATGKPLLMARPVAPGAEVDWSGPVASLPLLDAEDSSQVVECLEMARSDDRREALVRRHFGDTTPGASMGRFLAACEQVIAARDEALVRLGG